MAQRYGRKQKAKARAKIAELTKRLDRESTAHMYLPGDVPDLDIIARVVNYSVTEDGGVDQMIERRATITVVSVDEVYEMIRNQTMVQFQGKQYTIVNGAYDAHYKYAMVGGPAYCDLELVGVAS